MLRNRLPELQSDGLSKDVRLQERDELLTGKHSIKAVLLDNVREDGINTYLVRYPEIVLASAIWLISRSLLSPRTTETSDVGNPNNRIEHDSSKAAAGGVLTGAVHPKRYGDDGWLTIDRYSSSIPWQSVGMSTNSWMIRNRRLVMELFPLSRETRSNSSPAPNSRSAFVQTVFSCNCRGAVVQYGCQGPSVRCRTVRLPGRPSIKRTLA